MAGSEKNNDLGFSDYEETTLDLSPWLLVCTLAFAVSLVFCLPLFVAIAQRQQKSTLEATKRRRVWGKGLNDRLNSEDADSKTCAENDEDDPAELSDHEDEMPGDSAWKPRRFALKRMKNAARAIAHLARSESLLSLFKKDPSEEFYRSLNSEEYLDIFWGKKAWWKYYLSKRWNRKLYKVVRWDTESRRLLKLAIPYTIFAVGECTSDILNVIIISRFLGTRALAAYYSVEFVVTLASMFMTGSMTCLLTLCSQAVGAGRYELAGEYVQISILLYQFAFAPLALLCIFYMDDLLIKLGFDANTVAMGQEYVVFAVLLQLFEPYTTALQDLLDIIGYEDYVSIFGTVHSLLATACLLGYALSFELSLRQVGLIFVFVDIFMAILNISIIAAKGWLRRYWGGILGCSALTNAKTWQTFLSTAIPLSLGYVLEYGEWEVLFIFASYLGPAEVAAWGLLGTLWETLETITLATADAAEVRVAFLLGAGRAAHARHSAHKSIFFAYVVAVLSSITLCAVGPFISTWMTHDETIQQMVSELILFLAMGNMALTLGSISWTLLGAQGRYTLATCMGFVGSWLVTLPLAALSSFWFQINLQGLVASVIVGCMVSGALNTFFLLRSKWDRLAINVMVQNEKPDQTLDFKHDKEFKESVSVSLP